MASAVARAPSGDIAERAAVDEFVGDEVHARRVANVMDRDDVRMVQRRRRPGFTDEPGLAVLVVGDVGRQDFQRDAAAEADVLSEIHLAHTALAEGTENLVVSEPCALVQTHGVRITGPARVSDRASGWGGPSGTPGATGSLVAAVMRHSRT
jgi:GMP synthase PP-ATPase subunit